MTLLYDFLVGTNADGSLSTENGVAERWEMSADDVPGLFGCAEASSSMMALT